MAKQHIRPIFSVNKIIKMCFFYPPSSSQQYVIFTRMDFKRLIKAPIFQKLSPYCYFKTEA